MMGKKTITFAVEVYETEGGALIAQRNQHGHPTVRNLFDRRRIMVTPPEGTLNPKMYAVQQLLGPLAGQCSISQPVATHVLGQDGLGNVPGHVFGVTIPDDMRLPE